MNRIIKQQAELGYKFGIECDDSSNPTHENFYDFSYTCPPYYDLEVYSTLVNDLSAAKSYKTFLGMLQKIMNNVFYSLKKNSLSVWVVGNFRDKNGYLVHFNGDVVKLGETAGFKLHDELIFHGASNCASQRCGQFEANRKSVRVHEYIIIFKKTIETNNEYAGENF